MENIFVEFLPPWVETGLQPAFYDKESGTVLQQTARMYARVNMLIRMFNKLSRQTKAEIERFEKETTDTVNDYINRFNELHDYVHDYFDNLDVQEEINNKLDDMTEEGTLQEIIGAYLDAKAMWVFDSVADMKLSTNLIDGSYAETLGYYSVNDGGDALYKVRESTVDDVIDEKFLVAIGEDGLVGELITTNDVNIAQIGGQQDTSTVINYVFGLGKSVYIPNLSFTLDSTITISNDNTKLICDGAITFTDENSVMLSIQNQRAIVKFNKSIEAPTDSTIIEICGGNHQVRYCDIYIHYVSECGIGILINPDNNIGCSSCTFRWDRINATINGIKIAPGDTNKPFVNGNFFIGGQLSAPTPIITRKGANQTDRFNQNVFDHIICSERNSQMECALDLQFMMKSWFNEMRMSEDHTGDYMIKMDSCELMHIQNFSHIDIHKILITNPQGPAYPNYFEGSYIRNSSDQWFATKVYELNGKFIVVPGCLLNPGLASLISEDDSTTFTEPAFYNDGMVVKIGAQTDNQTYEYTLPNVFERRGVKEFYIYVSNKPLNTRLRVFDSSNNSVIEFKIGRAMSQELYHVITSGASFAGAPSRKVTKVEIYTGN